MIENLKPAGVNLVPDTANPTPDYYCTWQTQLYATSDGRPKGQRAIMSEKSLFCREKPFGWAYFYEKARKDLFLVMDDSWDVPEEDDPSYYGSLALDSGKFPEATSGTSNAAALKRLSEKVKSLGWKGLGGWVCAQEAQRLFVDGSDFKEYWRARLKEAGESGFCYWKVDWGKKAGDIDFRRFLTDEGRKIAPSLVIEHAMTKDIIPFADVYRTYDVPAIMSIPMTMEKLREFSDAEKARDGYMGLINCEDEAYIAAACGFSMGIMRHPYAGALPDGRADMSFPEVHRNLKTKMTEIIRAARWHRIAPAFGMNKSEFNIDSHELTDFWHFEKTEEEIESWWVNFMPQIRDFIKDKTVYKTAPARISRRIPLPEVLPDENGNVPFAAASLNPCGAYGIVLAGRTMGRNYFIPQSEVIANIAEARTVGIFGSCKSITLKTGFDASRAQIFAQDLADDENGAFDITGLVSAGKDGIFVPGKLISEIGTICQPQGDTSEPGIVIKIEHAV